MNILFITRGYPSKIYKTLGIFEYDMAKSLVKAGHTVTYMSVDVRSVRRWRKWGYESFQRDRVNIEAINIPIGRIYNPLKTKISEFFLLRRFKYINRVHGRFDVIHAHFIGSAYLAARLKDVTGIPLIITEHSSKLNKPLDRYIKNKLIYAYNKADILTTVSKYLSEVIYQKFNLESAVIPNIINTDIFHWKKLDNYDKKSFIFVSTGNLIKEKGMDITIKAFSEIAYQYDFAKLLIFGQGIEETNLSSLIKELNLEDKVKLMGLVSRDALSKYYRKSKVFVLASFSETFGVAYIEALAMGLPIIATDCGGPSEFINSENGITVPINDVKSLAKAMQNIIIDYIKFDPEKISDEISRKFSEDQNVISLIKIYEKALDGL